MMPMAIGPIFNLANVFGEHWVRYVERSLVDEDEAVISRGATIGTKNALRELEHNINYASFILAPDVIDRQPIVDWISEARKTAFCLADQIAMYAIEGSSKYQLYHMKYDIGMCRIEELTTKIEGFMTKFSEMYPFIIHRTRDVPEGAIIKRAEIAKIEGFLTDDHSVLFIIGGQGSGKTTLMKGVYQTKDVGVMSQPVVGRTCSINQFCWVDMAETGSLIDLLKMVLKESNVDHATIGEFEIINMIHETLKEKYCLIVLDNVQDTSVLDSLKIILEGLKWKIICLTRRDIQKDDSTDVVIRISGLGRCDSFKLFLSAAFPNFDSTALLQRENPSPDVMGDVLHKAIEWKNSYTSGSLLATELEPMVNLLNGILTRCQSNPWNIWNIGSLLGDKHCNEWQEVKEQIDGMLIDGTKPSEKCDPREQLQNAVADDAVLGHCFLYCLAFPKTSESEAHGGIPTRKLFRLWAAEGYVQDSLRLSQEQEAEYLLDKLIKKNLLVVMTKGFDGEVLKCSVNEHIRPLAEKMCEYQKFCKVADKDADEASSPSRMTKCLPINPNILIRRKKPLSDRYRMLAVHGDGGVKQLSKTLGKDIRLRSLLHFKTGRTEQPELKLTFRRTNMLLRTLELQGANVAKLTPNIDCLVCLRYLGLRGNKLLQALPLTLQNLTHLMCLDIRDTGIQELADVSDFEEMRHLYLTNSFRGHSVAVREGLHSLVNLQTLSGAAYGVSSKNITFEKQIEGLAGCLRKLSMKKIPGASSQNICGAIKKVKHLQSLAISCEKGWQKFDLSALKIAKNLRKLKLGGPMCNFYDLVPFMKSITFLYLWESELSDDIDLLKTLQGLNNLVLLSLVNISTIKDMICSNGYKNLKKLSIISMEKLETCSIDENAMGSLQMLVFANCGKLKSLPKGIAERYPLPEVHLTGMVTEFCTDAEKKLKGKVYFAPDVVSRDVRAELLQKERATPWASHRPGHSMQHW